MGFVLLLARPVPPTNAPWRSRDWMSETERNAMVDECFTYDDELRKKITKKYGLKLIPGFRCDFRDPFGNRIQVVDLHDESLVWLLSYQEVQKVGIKFSG